MQINKIQINTIIPAQITLEYITINARGDKFPDCSKTNYLFGNAAICLSNI